MRPRALLLLLLLLACTAQIAEPQNDYASCHDKVQLLWNAALISDLPAEERSGVIQAVLPELERDAKRSGYDPQDLVPARLSTLLRYKHLPEISGGLPHVHILVVSFNYPTACGNHGQCPTYLLGANRQTVHSIVKESPGFGRSIGGTWGVAVLNRKGSPYPDLLSLATISGQEIAVTCFRWSGTEYAYHCDVPCARILAHPQAD